MRRMPSQPSASSMISNAAGGSIQGRIQGANQGMQSVARVVGPLTGAGLYTGSVFAAAVLLCGNLGLRRVASHIAKLRRL